MIGEVKDEQGNGWFEMPVEFGVVFIGAGIAVGISLAVAVLVRALEGEAAGALRPQLRWIHNCR
jgi:hypothetical protein